MGSCLSKRVHAARKNRAKSTVSEANSSDADERAVRKTAPGEKTATNGTAALPDMAQVGPPLMGASTSTVLSAATTAPTNTATVARRSSESESAPVRSLSPPPVPRPLSPASPSQSDSSPAAAGRQVDVLELPTRVAAVVAPDRTAAPPTPPARTNGCALSPRTDGNGTAAPATPSPRIITLAERRTASPVGSLTLERKITPADGAAAGTPPPPAPTPPPLAPTPPPMPPTPPPARGSMATISEDAPLPSPTKLSFVRRSGPPRGTFGYTFQTPGPPHSPGEPSFGYFPSSAPISRTASPAFGGASKSAPISRTASPAPAPAAEKSPESTLGGLARTTFGYDHDDEPGE